MDFLFYKTSNVLINSFDAKPKQYALNWPITKSKVLLALGN